MVTDQLPALGFTSRRGPLALAWGDNHGTRRRAPDAELGADRAEIAADTISRRREIARRAVLARRRPMLLRGAAGKLLLTPMLSPLTPMLSLTLSLTPNLALTLTLTLNPNPNS